MSKYMTRQRRQLLEYLGEHADEQVSAQQIAGDLRQNGVSLSAVYRNLAELEAQGQVRRSGTGASKEVLYQYIGAGKCRRSLHMSCMLCGKTVHMDAQGAARLEQAVEETEGFEIDTSETVLYGVCRNCRR